VEGEVYTADPQILNGSPLFTTEAVLLTESLGAGAWAKLFEAGGMCEDVSADACAPVFLEQVAPRVMNRPLTDEERADFEAFHTNAVAEFDAETAGEMLYSRVLLSPSLLYRWELGVTDEETGLVTLTPHELAANVSYTLTDQPPDDELWAAAQDGPLSAPAALAAHARRLLDATPEVNDVVLENDLATRQVRGLLRFFREWLDVEKVRDSSFTFRQRVKEDRQDAGLPTNLARMKRWFDNETMLFLRLVLWLEDGSLESILSADYSVYSNTLNDFYRLDSRDMGFETGDKLPAAPGRRGLLTQAGFLTSHATTSLRGEFIRARMFCTPVPVPAGVDNNLSTVEASIREQEGNDINPRRIREIHLGEESCSGCHALIDPLAYPLDVYDGIGEQREDWDGFPIDASGTIQGTASTDAQLANADDLVDALSTSRDVEDCFVEQLYHYVHGRPPAQEDTCYVQKLQDGFHASGGDVRELMVQMVIGEEMRTRTAERAAPSSTGE